MGGRRSVLWVVAAVWAAAVGLFVVAAVPGLGFVARGIVSGVFLLAGAAKLRDRAGFSEALAGLGIPGSIRPAVAWGLPVLELALAGALLVPQTATAGAVGALILLVVLTVAVGGSLTGGRAADCGCFGRDRSASLSGLTLLRNGVLVGLAGGVALVGLERGAAYDGALSAGSLVAIGVAALMTAALLGVRKGDRETSVEPTPGGDVGTAGATGEAILTRRRWIRAAGGAGLAAAAGPALGWLGPTAADAVTNRPATADRPETCESCSCARSFLRVCLKWDCTDCYGYGGGGMIQTASGTAHASFVGDNLQLRGSRQKATVGALTWFDPSWKGTGLSLQSTRITSYRRVPGTNIRELVGFASANGRGRYRFVLRVVDAGRPGSGSDTVKLTVSGVAGSGAGGTGSHYTANGRLAQGDITTKLLTTVTAT